jgi:hypothetical protein
MSLHSRRFALLVPLLGIACFIPQSALHAEQTYPPLDAIRAAVKKSLPLLEAGAKGSMEQRKQCFTCHNQGLPIFALTTARTRGFEIDGDHLQTQLKFTADFLAKNREKYLQGKGQGGQIDTAGYALWTLDNGGWKPDETTAAVAEYFLRYQADIPHWKSASKRPPSEQSPFTSSFLALRGLKRFGTPEQQVRIDSRIEEVRNWLVNTLPDETEDRVFRLRALHAAEAPTEEIRTAADALKLTQRPDGGWSQLPDLDSDAYATGSALVALLQTGTMTTSEPAYRQGLNYLITTQQDDGSWFVKSRSKPFQTYFESGYPHGTDQFISIAAAGWATTALSLALPETP